MKKIKHANEKRVSLTGPVLLLVIGLIVGMVLMLAVENSQPGDLFYALKRAVESFQLASTTTPAGRVSVSLGQANERMAEIQRVIAVPVGANTTTNSSQTVITPTPGSGSTVHNTTLLNIPPDTLQSLLTSYQENLGEITKQLPQIQPVQNVVPLTEEIVGTTLNHEDILENLSGQVDPNTQQVLNETLTSINSLTGGISQ